MQPDPIISHFGRFLHDHWVGALLLPVIFLLVAPLVTFPGGNPKTLWWVCAGCCLAICSSVCWGFYVLIGRLGVVTPPPSTVQPAHRPPATSPDPRPAAQPATRISRANPGRTFRVEFDGVGQWHRGQTFTDHEFRQRHPAPLPHPGDDPVAAREDYYAEAIDRLLASGAVSVVSPPPSNLPRPL